MSDTNWGKLLKVIEFVSWKRGVNSKHTDCVELCGKVTKYIRNLIEKETVEQINSRKELNTFPIMSQPFQPYTETLSLFFDYLKEWAEEQGDLEMASKKKVVKNTKNHGILKEVLQDCVIGMGNVLENDLALEPFSKITERKWDGFAQSIRKLREATELLEFILNLETPAEDLPELEDDFDYKYANAVSFGNWCYFSRNSLKRWAEQTEEKADEYRYDLDWK